MMTPMSKYYASEMCCRVADRTIQVLGGSGYMKDYPAERYLRDARSRRSTRGPASCRSWPPAAASRPARSSPTSPSWKNGPYEDPALQALKQKLIDAKPDLLEANAFIKQRSPSYLDLAARRLVDCALIQIMGHLLLHHASRNGRKKHIARRYIENELPVLHMKCAQIRSGDTSPLDKYEALAGPVPSTR